MAYLNVKPENVQPRFVLVWYAPQFLREQKTATSNMTSVWNLVKLLEMKHTHKDGLTYRIENYDHAQHERSTFFY